MRKEILNKIARHLESFKADQVILVAIDGIDASGKTSFADDLKELISERPVLRLSLDYFHFPKEQRYKRGYLSPEGYYFDAFDYPYLMDFVLKPLIEGQLTIPTKHFDYRSEKVLRDDLTTISENTIVLFDGVFLMREQLSPFWDYSIFLDITFDEAMNRGLKRDIHYFKDQKQLVEKYNKRYLPAQSMYLSDVKPKELVNMVIDHNDFKNPRIILERS